MVFCCAGGAKTNVGRLKCTRNITYFCIRFRFFTAIVDLNKLDLKRNIIISVPSQIYSQNKFCFCNIGRLISFVFGGTDTESFRV